MRSECRQPGKQVCALGICLLLFAATWSLPSIATAQTEITREGKLVDKSTGEEVGTLEFFLEVDYGLSTPRFDGLDETFNTLGLLELKLGYTILGDDSPGIARFLEYYAFGSAMTEGLNSSGGGEDGEVRSELGRFGFGNRLGYGYGDQNKAFSLYNQNSLNWTKVEPVDYDETSPDAQAIFDRYGASYRFGWLFEAGFKFDVTQAVALSLGAEGSVIYPRYVFWPWLGSIMIYSGVQSALEVVGARIIDSSPKLGPVLYFLLKNGASLGYYLLARQDMNWPFTSETPLTVESAKLGLSVRF